MKHAHAFKFDKQIVPVFRCEFKYPRPSVSTGDEKELEIIIKELI